MTIPYVPGACCVLHRPRHRGAGEAARRGGGHLEWLAEQLRTFVDLNPTSRFRSSGSPPGWPGSTTRTTTRSASGRRGRRRPGGLEPVNARQSAEGDTRQPPGRAPHPVVREAQAPVGDEDRARRGPAAAAAARPQAASGNPAVGSAPPRSRALGAAHPGPTGLSSTAVEGPARPASRGPGHSTVSAPCARPPSAAGRRVRRGPVRRAGRLRHGPGPRQAEGPGPGVGGRIGTGQPVERLQSHTGSRPTRAAKVRIASPSPSGVPSASQT